MTVPPLHAAPPSRHVASDLAALKRGGLAPAEQRAAVASQFEAILIRQFLQESVGSMMGGGNKAAGSDGGGGSVYGFMLTDSLAQKLTEGGGMGLAPMIAKQLTPRGIPVTPPPLAPAT
ncbi:MAG: hypothetical protein WCI28_06785 [Opitutaceae bacterium]|jgi:flagellar protein FlgJ